MAIEGQDKTIRVWEIGSGGRCISNGTAHGHYPGHMHCLRSNANDQPTYPPRSCYFNGILISGGEYRFPATNNIFINQRVRPYGLAPFFFGVNTRLTTNGSFGPGSEESSQDNGAQWPYITIPFREILAGLPITVTPDGTSRVTTLPAPTMASSSTQLRRGL